MESDIKSLRIRVPSKVTADNQEAWEMLPAESRKAYAISQDHATVELAERGKRELPVLKKRSWIMSLSFAAGWIACVLIASWIFGLGGAVATGIVLGFLFAIIAGVLAVGPYLELDEQVSRVSGRNVSFLASMARPNVRILYEAIQRHNTGIMAAIRQLEVQRKVDKTTGEDRHDEIENRLREIFAGDRTQILQMIKTYEDLREIGADEYDELNGMLVTKNFAINAAGGQFKEELDALGAKQEILIQELPTGKLDRLLEA